MRFSNHFFAIFLLFYIRNEFVLGDPIYGEYVRLAYSEEFQYVVSIKRITIGNANAENDHFCSGVLVSRKDVVTVDHCMSAFEDHMAEVIVGSNDIRSGMRHYVAWWFSYAIWANFRNIRPQHEKNDITMIRLTHATDDNIPTARLPTQTDVNIYWSRVKVGAFGKNVEGEMSRFMETAKVTIIPRRQCSERLTALQGSPYHVTENYFCGIADPVVLMTKGNSGAAVEFNGEFIAMHKGTAPPHIPDPFHPQKVNIFINIRYYKQFILEAMNI